MQMNHSKPVRLILFLMVASGTAPSLKAELADGIKAVVNDAVVTYSQVEQFTAPAADTLRQQYADSPNEFHQKLNNARDDSLEQLVERQLILRAFDVEGYQLPEDVVDQLVQDRIRERFGDRVTFIKTLQAQGMTVEQFRKEVRDQYIVSALRQKNVSQEIIVSPYKVETYYQAHQDDFKVEDQVKLRMIVLNKTSPDDTNTVERAREIRAQIKQGASFQQMASVYSDGSQKSQGGDWGWVDRSVLRKDLADVAFTLKPGEMSDAINTSNAVFLMLVEKTRPAHIRPLNEVRDDIDRTLRAREQAQLEKKWIDRLKSKTFIRYF